MKVLLIIHTQGHGGAENIFRWLAWGLQREGVDVIAAIPEVNEPGTENWITSALEELEIPYVTFDKSGSPWRLLKNMELLIDRVEPDIVHSHLLDSNFYSSLACRRKSVPHVCTEHGDVFFGVGTRVKLKYILISLCSNFLVCVSESVKEKVSGVIPFTGKLKTVYNGIHFFRTGSSTFRAEFGISTTTVLIGNVGNLYAVKGQKYLIRAFAELLVSHPDICLVLVGRGDEDKNLKEQVRDLGIADGKVVFTGFRSDIENVLNAVNLYVQPSLSEGHPVAVLEAMSLGIPVIASAVGGVPELVGLEQYGTLVTPGSWEDLFERMREYSHSPVLFQEKAQAAKNYVQEAFSIEKMARNYISIYQKVFQQGGYES